jgi:hypothetical protein
MWCFANLAVAGRGPDAVGRFVGRAPRRRPVDGTLAATPSPPIGATGIDVRRIGEGVAVGAMGLLTAPMGETTPNHGVLVVVGRRSGVEVVWVHTAAIVALVENPPPLGNDAARKSEGEPVGAPFPCQRKPLADVDFAVPVRAIKAGPLTATGFTGHHAGPELFVCHST